MAICLVLQQIEGDLRKNGMLRSAILAPSGVELGRFNHAQWCFLRCVLGIFYDVNSAEVEIDCEFDVANKGQNRVEWAGMVF